MSDDLDNSTEHDDADDSSVIKELRKRADRADAAEAKASELERRLALSQAGLTGLNEDQQNALIGAHKGDWSDVESVKQTAERLGWAAQSVTEPPAAQIPADELAAHDRVAAAASGTPVPTPDLDTQIAEAKSEAEVLELLRNAGVTASG